MAFLETGFHSYVSRAVIMIGEKPCCFQKKLELVVGE
jgi:hypothetical protein